MILLDRRNNNKKKDGILERNVFTKALLIGKLETFIHQMASLVG